MLNQATVVNIAKTLITLDSQFVSGDNEVFDSNYDNSLIECENRLEEDFDRYYNAPLNPTYTKVEEYSETTSLFTFNVNPYLQVADKVLVSGTEYSDMLATVRSITKNGTEWLVELNIIFTDDDGGSVTNKFLNNYYQGHAYWLCYIITSSFQKIHKDDVLITVKDFGDGALSTNSQIEINDKLNHLLQKGYSFFGKSITFEVL